MVKRFISFRHQKLQRNITQVIQYPTRLSQVSVFVVVLVLKSLKRLQEDFFVLLKCSGIESLFDQIVPLPSPTQTQQRPVV